MASGPSYLTTDQSDYAPGSEALFTAAASAPAI